ncbi:MAG: DUF5335 family protein [Gemmatimonadota bacterium]
MTQQIPRINWAAELQSFTTRNAGRITLLEEFDREIGPVDVERDYPLRGVSYDRRDDRIDIMLGDRSEVGRHLTHTIGDVLFVGLVSDRDGADQGLRILRRDGAETVLGFRRISGR